MNGARSFIVFLFAILVMLLARNLFADQVRDQMREKIIEGIKNMRHDGSAHISLPDGATVQSDISYGDDPLQKMDVYIPKNANNAPVIFMVHGGAWAIGDKANTLVVKDKVFRWVPKGIIFMSINYRMLPEVDPLEQAKDVARALSRAQQLAASWGGDPARFILMGHSAGAHLIALLTADPSIAFEFGAKPWLGAVLLDSAALDVVSIMQAKHARLYDKPFGSDPSYWKTVSPFHRVSSKTVPVLAVCSTKRADSCEQAQGFVVKISSLGSQTKVLQEDMSHGDIGKDIGKPGSYTENVESFMRSLGVEL